MIKDMTQESRLFQAGDKVICIKEHPVGQPPYEFQPIVKGSILWVVGFETAHNGKLLFIGEEDSIPFGRRVCLDPDHFRIWERPAP